MDKLVIKKGTKQIDPHQYEGRLDIEELIIADTVEVIGEAAFYGCSNLKKITWGKRVCFLGIVASAALSKARRSLCICFMLRVDLR